MKLYIKKNQQICFHFFLRFPSDLCSKEHGFGVSKAASTLVQSLEEFGKGHFLDHHRTTKGVILSILADLSLGSKKAMKWGTRGGNIKTARDLLFPASGDQKRNLWAEE